MWWETIGEALEEATPLSFVDKNLVVKFIGFSLASKVAWYKRVTRLTNHESRGQCAVSGCTSGAQLKRARLAICDGGIKYFDDATYPT